jgi:hypothetical protein
MQCALFTIAPNSLYDNGMRYTTRKIFLYHWVIVKFLSLILYPPWLFIFETLYQHLLMFDKKKAKNKKILLNLCYENGNA